MIDLVLFKILASTDQVPVGSGDGKVNIPKIDSIDLLAGVLNGAYIAAGVFAVVIIILAGFTFATGSYDATKITKAKNAILYSVVGLIAIIAAFALTQFILDRFK